MNLALTILGLFCISQSLSAQAVGQGAWMVGGSAGFESESFKDIDGSQTTIRFAPNLGYFIADDLAIGLALTVESFSPLDDDFESVTNFALGPFVRFYFADAIFAQAGVNLGLGDFEFTEFQVGVGYSWFLNNSVAIEPMLFYRSHGVDDPGIDSSVIGLSIGVQAFLDHEHGME